MFSTQRLALNKIALEFKTQKAKAYHALAFLFCSFSPWLRVIQRVIKRENL